LIPDLRSDAKPKRLPSMAVRAYEALVDGILSGAFPEEVLISEQSLADRLGMSRTPIRRALAQLEADRLVRVLPRRGLVVESLTSRQLTEIFQFREALEVLAAREAPGFNLGHLAKLDAVFAEFTALGSQGDPSAVSAVVNEADEQLHRLIVAATMNRLMIAEFDRLRLQMAQIRAASWAYTDMTGKRGLTVGAADHRLIIRALCDGDRELAAQALTAHIRSGKDHLLRVVASPQPEERSPWIRRPPLVVTWLRDDTVSPDDVAQLVRDAVIVNVSVSHPAAGSR